MKKGIFTTDCTEGSDKIGDQGSGIGDRGSGLGVGWSSSFLFVVSALFVV